MSICRASCCFSVRNFTELIVLNKEEILIKIRADPDSEVKPYDFQRKAPGSMTVNEWLNGRLIPKLGDLQVDVISGNYSLPHGRTKLSTLRDSYSR